MPKLSIVIPCYGSEATLKAVVEEIQKTCAVRSAYDYEIILVNDGSPDCVFDVITELSHGDERIIGIDLARNFGQHAALMAGFNHASGDIVVCMDDDGQTPASELFLLVDKLKEGYDMVFARYEEKKHSFFRNLGSALNEHMARYLLGKPKNLALMSYFACRRFVTDAAIRYTNPYPYVAGLLLRVSANATNVTIQHRQRVSGQSGYTYRKLFSLWLNGFTAFSVKPLRLAGVMGFFCALSGFLYIIYMFIRKLLTPDMPAGYASTMAAIFFVGGMIMLLLGLIGEYLGRMYISVNNLPQYAVRKTLNYKKKDS